MTSSCQAGLQCPSEMWGGKKGREAEEEKEGEGEEFILGC